MKTLKTLLFVFAVVAIFSAGAHAQTETQDVNVTAQVQAQLSLSKVSDIDLGTIEPEAVELQANANDAASTGTSGTAGQVDISGTANIDLDVSWTSATLDDGNSNTVTFNPEIWVGSSSITSGDAGNVTLDGSGNAQLDIGGSADFSGAPAGTYNANGTTGTPITITVVYN